MTANSRPRVSKDEAAELENALVLGIVNWYCSPSFGTVRSLSSGAHPRDPLAAASGSGLLLKQNNLC
jgi:hypothetical protein